MAGLFHKPIKKELSAILDRKKPPPKPKRLPPPQSQLPTQSPQQSQQQQQQHLRAAPPPSTTTPTPDPDFDEPPPPTGSFTDFKLVSSARTTWKYDVMKFDARGKDVDPTRWTAPVKLNRKDYRQAEADGAGGGGDESSPPVELKPMLGPDGKPVIGIDGKIVMVGPDGKVPQANGANGSKMAAGAAGAKGKGKGKQPFKKKTKQVFLVPEATRQLRREERYPWVMEEGGEGGQVWVGHIENPEKALTHALFVPNGNQFNFLPAHRWYKFQKRPTYRILALEEAEAELAKTQKNKDPERWLMRKKAAGKGPSDATLATLKAEKENESHNGFSTAGDGSTLRAVDSGDRDLFGDEDDEEEKINRKRKDKEMGGEGDLDEIEFEDDFADDEEKMEMDGDDEETKELEERLKREYRTANKLRDGRVDEDEEEEEEELTGAGKDLRKLVRKSDKNEGYESDDEDKNPYLSEEEEVEEPNNPVTPLDGPAVMNQAVSQPGNGTSTPPRPNVPPTQQQQQQPTTPRPNKVKNKVLGGASGSRSNSPGLGNAVVAKRATSPRVPKPKAAIGSRAGSPLASSGSRGASPVPAGSGSRTGSPGASASRAESPAGGVAAGKSLKRKAADDVPSASATPGSGGGDPMKPKKKIKRADGPLEESMVIAFLREKKEATTKDCIMRFSSYVRDEETKKAFTAMVKKVAIIKNNALQLRPEYQ